MIPFKDDNPTRTIPVVTIAFIALNIFVFIVQLMSDAEQGRLAYTFGAIPSSMFGSGPAQPVPPYITVFSSMFMHGGLFHIGGNMLYLWIFGNNVEDALGHLSFIVFYLFCGIAAALSHALLNPSSTVPMIGASGAISGVLGAYLVLFPHARVHTLVFLGFFVQVIRVPALIVIGFWAIIQVLNGLIAQGMAGQGGVAWFAHVGGFVAGLVTIRLWPKRRMQRWS
ncbi:MAG: rhomboid family intramembrane serine protease [Thermodesulfovibrionales bacterium]